MPNDLACRLACSLAVCTIGCATLINGSTQNVAITSNPPGASATVLPEQKELVTPGQVELPRRQVHTVLFQLEGYQPATIYLDRNYSYWTAGNLILGGVVGLAVDQSTGANYRLVPEPVHVDLVPVGASAAK